MMTQKLHSRFAVLCMVAAMVFGAAFTAYAYDDLEIEIDIRANDTLVEVEYTEDGDEVEEEYEYDTVDLDEVYERLAADLDLSEDVVRAASEVEYDDDREDADEAIEDAEEAIAKAEEYIASLDEDDKDRDNYQSWLEIAEGYLEEAKAALAEREYEEAEDKAEMAEDKAKLIYDKDDDEYVEKQKQEKCKANPGRAIAYAASDGKSPAPCGDEWNKDKDKKDKFKDYGKSTDREELQMQLRELLTLLIQLLQQQMAMQQSS